MSVLIFYALLVFTIVSTPAKGQGYQPTDKEFEAIRKVETGGCPDPLNAVGDNGKSIGPYQIGMSYYKDAKEQDPSLPEYNTLNGSNESIENSENVMRAYSNRYTTALRLGRKPTFMDFARNHNGGPNGWKKDATLDYYKKVKQNLPGRKRHANDDDAGEYLGCPLKQWSHCTSHK